MTTIRNGRVPQRRIAETVAAELRDLILDVEDYRLPTQEQLVKDFGVSYPSIREALRILETEGLVTVRRGNVGGADVHRPDETSAAYHLGLSLQAGKVTLRDLADGLRMLEPLCAAECAKRSDRAEVVVPALTAAIDSSIGLVTDGVEFTHTARDFHDLVVSFAPNATIRYAVGSYVALWSAQEEAWAEARTRHGEYPSQLEAEEAVRAHRRLVDEIAAGNAAEAERLARAHLAATQSLVLERYGDRIVNASAAMSRQAIHPGRRSRI
ncbi:FadR/GntR family transcriptional regulator [Gordonia hankookensis]|uniref:FadR family transcriptional regulator n=1 Tax=Gordonia hankookensis TaxID=589403 RepID=A0ABR7WHI7_9ACTN|nr:GntR family transcriptional regulator [Gordonia hankookensis]MBD1321194.1 FadR family transcriptional regulator [Gordonia hankookensis]NDZ96767.1 FadR family transcriptional regulator [Streptomyces sp. SID11726]NEB23215.1 FadR family transcriptional regulator [Streptomyces sp. SID6673]